MSDRMSQRKQALALKAENLAKQKAEFRKTYKGEAVCEKTKTPGGPRFKGPNQYNRRTEDGIRLFGEACTVEHFRDGELIGVYDAQNMVVNEGLNATLGVMINADTQITVWYMGLINLTGYTAIALTDTYDDINQVANGWDEFDDYTDANNSNSATTRPVFVAEPPSGQSITKSVTKSIFDITAGGTVKGIFIVGGGANSDDKNDHANDGTLLSAALFSGGDVAVVNGDQLKVTYTLNAANP